MINKEELIKLIEKTNNNQSEIARILNLGRTTISNYYKKYDLKSNPRGFNKKYYANDNYFKIWSHNMAYILGFISADGHVWKNRPFLTIGISNRDIAVLEFIKNEISPDSIVRQDKTHAQICVHSKGIWEDLNNLGINHDKTFNLKLPNIPEKYFPDYLRGYFDGMVLYGVGKQKLKSII